MMICRCPGCGTPFRVTPQQIKVRNGLVRCGECKIVFNALDQLVEGQDARPPSAPPLANVAATLGVPAQPQADNDPRDLAAHLGPLQAAQSPAADAEPAAPLAHGGHPEFPDSPVTPAPPAPSAAADDAAPAAPTRAAPEPRPVAPTALSVRDEASPLPAHLPDTLADPQPDLPPSPDETRKAALAAGLVAPRELRTAPGYSRWAETALSRGRGPELSGPARGISWLYGLLAILLLSGLAAQAAYHYRTEVATRWPATRPWLERACERLACTVELPRRADLVSIEASDLHSDPERGGLLVLQATLRNRAPFAQALPALELTITDTEDRAVARRVLLPADYLPADPPATGTAATPGHPATAQAFAANGELLVRLWIDARDVGAAGYRLYLFYP